MYLKRRLMKAASICSYVFTGLWLIAAACCFAFSNGLYWLLLIFGLACLYNGFVITSISESMTEVSLEKARRANSSCAGSSVSSACPRLSSMESHFSARRRTNLWWCGRI